MTNEWKYDDAWNFFMILLLVVLDLCVAVLITMFLKFHIKLLKENKTTIENLESKGKTFESTFD